MFYEYAIDPELAATWYDRKKFKDYKNAFCMDNGRIISSWPMDNLTKWKKLVRDAFERQISKNDPKYELAYSLLTQHLSYISEAIIIRQRRLSFDGDWLEETEYEHNLRHFRCILSLSNPREKSFVVTAKEVDDDLFLGDKDVECWKTPITPCVPRTVFEFTKVVAPLLRNCRHAVFVDPHFDPLKSRFLNPIKEMLAIQMSKSCDSSTIQAEIHVDGTKIKKEVDDFLKDCDLHLPKIIPSGRKLRIVLWKQMDNGERLHNRYILTDIGSVSFGTGLDVTLKLNELRVFASRSRR